jgi:Zn-dependent protease with chaperone function
MKNGLRKKYPDIFRRYKIGRVYLLPSNICNAFTFVWSTDVYLTEKYKGVLGEDCCMAVILHEMGHHQSVPLVESVSNALVPFFPFLALAFLHRLTSIPPEFFLLSLPCLSLITWLLFLWEKRKDEYRADNLAEEGGFGKALKKVLLISCIVEHKPLKISKLREIWHTHPSALNRIKHLAC